jgi:NAD(P)-dependent dehydrogenase (short-subunit alcohol dehydrogenase family)
MNTRVAFVTGASSAIGRAYALHLAAQGLRVYGTSRNPPGAPEPFTMLQMDVTDDSSVQCGVKRRHRARRPVNNV